MAQTQAPAQTRSAALPAGPGFYRYKVGDIEVTAINDGFAPRPLDGLIRNADSTTSRQAHGGGLPADGRAADHLHDAGAAGPAAVSS